MIKKRLNELSYMNLLFCVIVVFIHILSEPISKYDHTSFQYFAVAIPHRLSSFVVQGFLFLSGLKMYKFWKKPFKPVDFWFKKIKSIFAPYILWVAIFYCYFVSINYFPFKISDLLIYIINGKLVSPFYFIIALFQFYLLSPLFIWLTNKVKVWILLVFSAIITFVSAKYLTVILNALLGINNFEYSDRVFTTYLLYFIGGCIVAKYYEKVSDIFLKKKKFIYLAFVFTAIIEVLMFFVISKYAGWTIVELWHTIYCVIAIIFTFTLFSSIKEKNIHPFISAADRATYLVYLSHCLFLFFINSVMEAYNITSITTKLCIRFVFVYTATFSMSMIWNYLKNLVVTRRKK